MSSELRAGLSAWDGRATEPLLSLYARFAERRGFVGSLLRLMREPACEGGATWLIKHHLERGGAELSSEQRARFYSAAADLESWPARLHVLQCFDRAEVPEGSVADARRLLDRCAGDPNKFVRAWACGAWCELARAHPSERARAERLLDDAGAHDPSPAVRARVRQIRKRGPGW